jgi:hypothetical protein
MPPLLARVNRSITPEQKIKAESELSLLFMGPDLVYKFTMI